MEAFRESKTSKTMCMQNVRVEEMKRLTGECVDNERSVLN